MCIIVYMQNTLLISDGKSLALPSKLLFQSFKAKYVKKSHFPLFFILQTILS